MAQTTRLTARAARHGATTRMGTDMAKNGTTPLRAGASARSRPARLLARASPARLLSRPRHALVLARPRYALVLTRSSGLG
jgi:hypothetical protein